MSMRNRIMSLLIGVIILSMQIPAIAVSTNVISDEAGTVILRPTDATYVSQHGTDNDTNYYGESVMKVNNTSHNSGSNDWGQYGYMKFDIGGISKERITSATLRVYVENDGDKSSSRRTVGIYDTCDKDWDGTTLTWSNNPYPYAKTQLGTFEVNANGSSITDAGWREIDITDYVREHVENEFSFMVKMLTWPAYNVVLSSGTYTGDPNDFDSTVYNENMPQLVIDYCDESASPYSTTMLNPIRDTYVDQHAPNTNYMNDEYLQVNSTDNETRSDRYGRYAYMDFDISEIDKETLSTAKLWVYVDANSDTRYSTRTIGVFAPASTWSDSMTWSSGRVAANGDEIGTYTVTGNNYDITNYGWKCIDVTDYVKSVSTDTLSLMMQSINSSAHPVLIRSNEYVDGNTRPKLVIKNSNNIVDNLDDFSVEYSNGVVHINGTVDDEKSKQVLIRIFKPDNSLELIDQIESNNNGQYTYAYDVNDLTNGTYQVFVSIEDDENIRRTTFNIGNPTEITPIYLDGISTILKPTVNISASDNYLRDDKILTVYSTMSQNSESTQEQNILTVIALYNSDGTMKSYSASSIGAHVDSIEKLGSDIILPSDVTGMKLKVFTLEGENIYSGSTIPLSNAYIINRTEPSAGAGASPGIEPEDSLFIDDVVFPEYADKYSVYDISYYYGDENAYYEKVVLPGKTLTISGKIKNKQSVSANIGEAFYTQIDGKAQFVELKTWYTIKAGETREVSWDVPSEWTQYPPKSDPVYPSNWISDEGGLTTEIQDYYSENIKESVLVNTNSFIKGTIESINDIDCIKFVAPTTGYYEIAQIGGNTLTGQLYTENLVDTSDPLNGFEEIEASPRSDGFEENVIWAGQLEAGKTYAVRLVAKGNSIGAYTCSISVDTDGDGLPDIWEITKDLDGDGIEELPDADPYKSDIYVQINWMNGYKPEQESLDIVKEAFANSDAGYQNKGINLHNIWANEPVDYEIINIIEDDDGNINLNDILLSYFSKPIYKYIYHCALFGDRYSYNDSMTNSSGYSTYAWGQSIFIAMGCPGTEVLTTRQAAGTYMHELGHNLDLRHGGDNDDNNKPNYLSIMNYSFQFDGLEGTGQYDYSRYVLPDLDENHLIENDGFDKNGITSGTQLKTAIYDNQNGFVKTPTAIAGEPFDFNQNGKIDTYPVQRDINGDGLETILTSFNDWESIKLDGGYIGKRRSETTIGFSLQSVETYEGVYEMTYTEYLNIKQGE